jgi:hypothetical protein
MKILCIRRFMSDLCPTKDLTEWCVSASRMEGWMHYVVRRFYKKNIRVAGLFLKFEKKIHSTNNDPNHEEIFLGIHLNMRAMYTFFSTCTYWPRRPFFLASPLSSAMVWSLQPGYILGIEVLDQMPESKTQRWQQWRLWKWGNCVWKETKGLLTVSVQLCNKFTYGLARIGAVGDGQNNGIQGVTGQDFNSVEVACNRSCSCSLPNLVKLQSLVSCSWRKYFSLYLWCVNLLLISVFWLYFSFS